MTPRVLVQAPPENGLCEFVVGSLHRYIYTVFAGLARLGIYFCVEIFFPFVVLFGRDTAGTRCLTALGGIKPRRRFTG